MLEVCILNPPLIIDTIFLDQKKTNAATATAYSLALYLIAIKHSVYHRSVILVGYNALQLTFIAERPCWIMTAYDG